MSPTQRPNNLLEVLKGKSRLITLEIQLVTAWIREHRGIKPHSTEAPALSPEVTTLQSWRKISYRLHRRRSELKIELENVRMDLRAVKQAAEKTETDFFYLPLLSNVEPESELALAGV